MMPKFPFKCDDHYIYRSAMATATATVTGTATATVTAAAWATETVTSTAIDVYGLRWDYSNGWWHEWHFSSRKVKR